jgi:prevent-host-death family protein
MVIDDYRVTMTKAGVADLKARLSEYLRIVRRGDEVTVMDRDQPIARIVPFEQQSPMAVREPMTAYGKLGDLPLPPPASLTIDPVELLLAERRQDE